ncbi:site-specific DNA-methyltransferase [Listeria ilorinensis]|uniref:site-specific DNA-methyltransferase n=1 Tax=Listeria ilorinensis TaxID=2867439 RepID=UPI001EF40DD9|nr:site-specific DNA-methyltransferase [Listeria ilorinensis]
MIIEEIPVSQINPAAYNPRIDLQAGDPEYEKLKKSIEEFGYIDPLIWNKRTGNLVGGHQRFKILSEKGFEKITVSVIDVELDREKALNIALNKISGDWDEDKLAELMNELSDGDLLLTGFDEAEIDELAIKHEYKLDVEKQVEDDHYNTEEEAKKIQEPETKRGQLWRLGGHFLMCGDATIADDVSTLMQGKKADLIVTDPPYNVAIQSDSKLLEESGRANIKNDDMSTDEFNVFLNKFFEQTAKIMQNSAAAYVFHGSSFQREFENALNNNGIIVRAQCIWVKNNAGFGFSQYRWKHEPVFYAFKKSNSPAWYGDRKQTTVWRDSALNDPAPSTVWEISRDNNSDYEHPTQKPLDLLAIPIRNSSKRGDIVADLCGGSGSTMMSCEQLERTCYMMEIDPIFCDVIKKRFEKLTGKKAVLVE